MPVPNPSLETAITFASALCDAAFLVDGFGVIRFANGECEHLFSRSDFGDGLMADLFGKSDRDKVLSRIPCGDKGIFEAVGIRPGGEFPALISWSPIGSDGFAIVTVRDLSDRYEADSALRESGIWYRNLIEHAPYAVFINQGDSVVIANKACVSLFGANAAEDLIGKTPNDLFAPEYHDQIRERIQKLQKDGKPTPPLEEKIVRMDGSLKSVEVIAAPTRFGNDAAIHVLMLDITDRIRAKEDMEALNADLERRVAERTGELERFFSVSIDMLCISHADGYFKRLSPAFTNSLGWSVEELLAKPYTEFVHPEELEATIAEVQRQVLRGEPVLSFENRYRHKDGSWRVLSWKSVPQEGGFMFAVARDVTEEKGRQAELRQAKEEAEMASRAKSEFLSRMSHELRTPLNAVLGFAQLLELRYDDPAIKEASSSILRGGRHLLEMINEVLDLSRIESGNLAVSIEPVPVAGVISQAMNLLKTIARSSEIEMSIEGDICEHLHLMADRQRLLQVMVNLLSNAIKYNRTGGQVWIRCAIGTEGWGRIEVSDTGGGIDAKDFEQLFQPFQRFGDPGIEGTGLGLALSERFIKLMGGNLDLLKTSPDGSTFSIELQTAEAPYHEVRPTRIEPGESPSRAGKVLYIEDNYSNMRLLEVVLADWPNLRLIPAMQGMAGVDLAREEQPDLILLDLHLPDILGDEVLRLLKADPKTSSIPVVMLSADATPRQIKALEAAGAADYLTKPIDLSRLFAILKLFLPDALG